MDQIVENLIGTGVSTFTPLGCLRNCFNVLVLIFTLYVLLVIVFIFVQGG